MPSIAQGPNYAIDLDAGIARCRVWRRPDLTSEEGARCAAEMLEHFRKLAALEAQAMMLDLSEAPAVTGPKTEASLGAMVEAFTRVKKPIAVVVGDTAVRKLQMKRIVSEHGGMGTSQVFDRVDRALAWCRSSVA